MDKLEIGFEVFTFPREEEITIEVIEEFMSLHSKQQPRYERLMKMYKGDAAIFARKAKEPHKPDNRLNVNYAKYITDTFSGFFNGIPSKKNHKNDVVSDAINNFDNEQDMQDEEAELVKLACVYGHAFELMYQDEETKTNVKHNSPEDMFIVYDDTVSQKPLFAVRYGLDREGELCGTLYTEDVDVTLIGKNGTMIFGEESENVYNGLAVTEFIFNEERMGIYETVTALIDSYDKAMSEKTNDVDYFSDSYLKVVGAMLSPEMIEKIRDTRVINVPEPPHDVSVDIGFLDKPDSDSQTENLLDRIDKHIYQIAMVANISDESFGSSSGVALAYKLQPMSNLAAAFERKFQAALTQRYKMFMSLTTNEIPESLANEWRGIEFRFTRNIPKNVLEEAQTAVQLATIASRETTLSVLSVVPDVRAEIDRMDSERKDSINLLDYQQEVPEKETVEVVEKEDS
ncbi:phage portal protein [Brochothrix thermosphacta]|uniref:phage portal protein n=1 Tax=Brochothrix thermosphacta TaxID=2756 RepID=UPI0039AEB7E2